MDPGILYQPPAAWLVGTGQEGPAMFFWGDNATQGTGGYITYTFSQPAVGFEYWSYPRSNGGQFGICFDCPPAYSSAGPAYNFMNTSTDAYATSIILYANYSLSDTIHTVTISNLPDLRATYGGLYHNWTGYGQLGVDKFVLYTSLDSTGTSSVSSTSTSTVDVSPASSPSSSAPPSVSTVDVPAIAGGVAGGVVGLAIAALLLWLFVFRKKRSAPPQQDLGVVYGANNGDMAYPAGAMPIPIFFQPQPLPADAHSNGFPFSEGLAGAGLSQNSPDLSPESHIVPIGSPSVARPIKEARDTSTSSIPRLSSLSSPSSSVSPPSVSHLSVPSMSPHRDRDAGHIQGDAFETVYLPPAYASAIGAQQPGNGA